ncbi:hypothetical protein AVEN_8273-1 [Araneus ventricosus]|uniref:Uncharacterized protein n=1 Tax=Araneus ventricosus TaxID=182803 RepID=A0A4Y2F9J2_ARAVE|nr:hypothetical protein AVEN_8273-1 [Araneus ventricosus]
MVGNYGNPIYQHPRSATAPHPKRGSPTTLNNPTTHPFPPKPPPDIPIKQTTINNFKLGNVGVNSVGRTEVAAKFVGESPKSSTDGIYPAITVNKQKIFHPLNQCSDPMVYPLFYFEWSYGMRLEST